MRDRVRWSRMRSGRTKMKYICLQPGPHQIFKKALPSLFGPCDALGIGGPLCFLLSSARATRVTPQICTVKVDPTPSFSFSLNSKNDLISKVVDTPTWSVFSPPSPPLPLFTTETLRGPKHKVLVQPSIANIMRTSVPVQSRKPSRGYGSRDPSEVGRVET